MAVSERTYRVYSGPLTPERGRFLVLARYSLGTVFHSRLFTAFFTACFAWPIASAVLIYLHHNLSALTLLRLPETNLLAIDAKFFSLFLHVQGTFLGFLIAFLVGPALVSPDLRNNALPLYLSRPLSRAEYVLGKATVLVVLLSVISWIPGLLLFLFQSYMEGIGWMADNIRIAGSLVIASWLWIVLVSLLALAVSATVKWKPLASAALLGVFLVAGALGTAFNGIFRTDAGSLINLGLMVETVWADLFGLPRPVHVSAVSAWVSLATACGACILLLARKLRAYEVVR